MSHHEILAANAAGTAVILTHHSKCERGYLPTLQARLREIHALEVASDTNDLDVIADTTRRRVEGTFKTVADAARDPIGLVQGLPRGIVNLFKGTAAQARQFIRSASKAVH
jgi:hypothetical protein